MFLLNCQGMPFQLFSETLANVATWWICIHDIIWFMKPPIISSIWSIKSDPRLLSDVPEFIVQYWLRYCWDVWRIGVTSVRDTWHNVMTAPVTRPDTWHYPSISARTEGSCTHIIWGQSSDWELAHQPGVLAVGAHIRSLISILIDNACMALNVGLKRSPFTFEEMFSWNAVST